MVALQIEIEAFLALAIDSKGQIRYGCANYNIRSAATLLHVLSLIE